MTAPDTKWIDEAEARLAKLDQSWQPTRAAVRADLIRTDLPRALAICKAAAEWRECVRAATDTPHVELFAGRALDSILRGEGPGGGKR